MTAAKHSTDASVLQDGFTLYYPSETCPVCETRPALYPATGDYICEAGLPARIHFKTCKPCAKQFQASDEAGRDALEKRMTTFFTNWLDTQDDTWEFSPSSAEA